MSDTHGTETAAELAALAAILDILDTFKRRYLLMYLDGDTLRSDGPKGAMTPDLRERCQPHKPALIRFLKAAHRDIGERSIPAFLKDQPASVRVAWADMEYAARDVDALYCQLLRAELLDWGRAHRYPRLTVEYHPGATGADVPYRWITPGQRAWTYQIAGFKRGDLAAAYAEAQRVTAAANADKGKKSEAQA